MLAQLNGSRLLDIGAWDGELAARARSSTSFSEMVAFERQIDHIGALSATFDQVVITDLEHVRCLPGPNDVIILADVLEHLSHPERLLEAVRPAVRDGGAVIISIPNVANLANRLSLLAGRFDYEDRGLRDRTHLRFYTLKSARALIRDAGFRIERVETSSVPVALALPFLPRFVLRGLEWLTDLLTALWPRMMGYQFIFVARPDPGVR